MIIIEGPDNSGKSTLAAFLSYELSIPVYHGGGPPASKKELMGRAEFILKNHDQFIFDRVPFISEPVYSILRGENLLYGEDELYNRLGDLKPIIIYCRPPEKILMEEDSRDRKVHDTEAHLEKLWSMRKQLVYSYDIVMEKMFFTHHWRYDYTTQEHDVLVKEIRNEILRLGHYKNRPLQPSVERQ